MTITPANENEPRPQWYDDLVRQYDPFLRNFCRTKFRHDEDLYQEAHVVLIRTWKSYRPGKSIIPWMRYAVMTARKKARKDAGMTGSVGFSTTGADGEEYSREIFGSVEASQDTLSLASIMIDKLAPAEKGAVIGRLQGMTFEEIGTQRGVQRQAVHERFRSAISKLRPANDNSRKNDAAA